ncbi:type B 50S ribosomal protein L31 [Flagellatimonas centrodinii]|uniref:type B 50S ribosomal protein L31 n=1 Tax=Flagellatimonas centrodinii TaxID=2806210 RepID=UPI001FF0660F|nr:type B 50S ribosomal protein L31 [Flagellatimonas centrodinii]ULQ47864.1 type B 50S ribosomal protein L31 [Flagellatimonas centrodinii]
MKDGIHPQYDYVVFKDASADFTFRVRSTLKSKERITWEDGKEYPLVTLDTSSKSHPFYTGKRTVSDTGGRIDKFRKRYGG